MYGQVRLRGERGSQRPLGEQIIRDRPQCEEGRPVQADAVVGVSATACSNRGRNVRDESQAHDHRARDPRGPARAPRAAHHAASRRAVGDSRRMPSCGAGPRPTCARPRICAPTWSTRWPNRRRVARCRS
jgi:hypothetical protein